jgi:hypothetical protein
VGHGGDDVRSDTRVVSEVLGFTEANWIPVREKVLLRGLSKATPNYRFRSLMSVQISQGVLILEDAAFFNAKTAHWKCFNFL